MQYLVPSHRTRCSSLYRAMAHHTYQVILGLGHVGVIRPQLRLVDFQGPLVVILYLLILALILAQ